MDALTKRGQNHLTINSRNWYIKTNQPKLFWLKTKLKDKQETQ